MTFEIIARQYTKMEFTLHVAVSPCGSIVFPHLTKTWSNKLSPEYLEGYSCPTSSAIIINNDDFEELGSIVLTRPLIVISKSAEGISIIGGGTENPIVYVGNLEAALDWCVQSCEVIGGRNMCIDAMTSPRIKECFIHTVHDYVPLNADHDKFPIELLPANGAEKISSFGNITTSKHSFTNTEEMKYHRLIQKLLNAPVRPNRTGIPAMGLFHKVLKFSLFDTNRGRILPLLTSKSVAWKSVFSELIWLLRGSTNTDYLVEQKNPIWNGNSSREYLDSVGKKNYREGELGPIYGHQWRSWGKEYIPEKERKTQQVQYGGLMDDGVIFDENLSNDTDGIDQIAQIIETLKTDPWSRRMVVSAWNVAQLGQMALQPCHYSYQFHVDPDDSLNPKYLNCVVNMRSSDMFLGVPFNIASYAMLTHIISFIAGLTPGKISISMADCHLYNNHIDATLTLLSRKCKLFPTMEFSDKISPRSTIDDFTNKYTINDYKIIGYKPGAFIKAPMAV